LTNDGSGVTDILNALPFSLLANDIVDGDRFSIIIVGNVIVTVGVSLRRGNDSDIDNTEAGRGLGLGGPSDSVSSVSGSEEEQRASSSPPS